MTELEYKETIKYLAEKVELLRAELLKEYKIIEHLRRKCDTHESAALWFATKLKAKCESIPQYRFNCLEVENCIDSVLKEMGYGDADV